MEPYASKAFQNSFDSNHDKTVCQQLQKYMIIISTKSHFLQIITSYGFHIIFEVILEVE